MTDPVVGRSATNPTGIYKNIRDAFNGWDADYVQVLITPGPMTAVDASNQVFYQGMGAFATGQTSYGAFISENLNVMNGGWGSANDDAFANTALSLSNWSVVPASNNSFIFVNPRNQSGSIALSLMPTSFSIGNAASGLGQLAAGSFVINDPITARSFNLSSNSLNLGSGQQIAGTSADVNVTRPVLNAGPVSQTSDNRNNFAPVGGKAVLDPVNAVNGEFYVDALDVRLNGPMPLDIRRNYGSQNLADGQFGYGWKLAYVPYLVVSVDANSTLIYAAEPDGSTIAYRRQASPNTRWIPTSADNPQLTNIAGDAAGSLTNVFNNYIDQTSNGGFTYYTLYGVDGSVRTFQVRPYATASSGATSGLTRLRPYLQTWQDNRGNFYTFTFGEDATALDWGQVKKVAASNGSFAGFNYDAYGHIIEAFTGDGRRLYYQYDDFGDLIQVTLPDASKIGYKYSHQPNANGPGFYSEHLLIEEDKPQGRVLVNLYDNATSRRVRVQRATAGPNFALVTNATFDYFTPNPTPTL